MIPDTDNAHSGNDYRWHVHCQSWRLVCEHLLGWLLIRITEAIGCKILEGPHLVNVATAIRATGEEPWHDNGGCTGIVVLNGSHAAIHTWPRLQTEGQWAGKIIPGEDGEANIDVYSCVPYEPEAVEKVLFDFLKVKRLERFDRTDDLRSSGTIVVPRRI